MADALDALCVMVLTVLYMLCMQLLHKSDEN